LKLEIRAPAFPESIKEGTIATWHRQPGEAVRRDEPLVDIETDKVVLEVVAPADGTVAEILKAVGDTIGSAELLGHFERRDAAAVVAPAGVPAAAGVAKAASPAARRMADEAGVALAVLQGSGREGRITKDDVQRAIDARGGAPRDTAAPAPSTGAAGRPAAGEPHVAAAAPPAAAPPAAGDRTERRVPMTRLRASIARRLVEAQRTAAMLTTFNEVDMSAVIALRDRYREVFAQRHAGARLGFMSFFVRACTEALKRFPAVNASIDGTDIVYHGFYDVGVAIGSERGLVVPVIRDADALSLAQIETQIRDYGARARDGKLSLEDLQGGTFTISNGGVYGSLLSTPILNPPQTAILGMHKVQERPVVVAGQVVARPMMYLALSYDHRLIDGQEAVRFLVAVKDMIEDPARILLEL
jgi:2-oxoglutarate dehydrogenase E2 component (dihydrolipoamide succinyltransferase)